MKNARVLARKVAKKEIGLSEAIDLLTESAIFEYKAGDKVYVAHGIHAGSAGIVIGESKGAYYNVDLRQAGKYAWIPAIFLQKNKNK